MAYLPSGGRKAQPETEGIETCTTHPKSRPATLCGRSQSPARNRGHRNGTIPRSTVSVPVGRKAQLETEGIETSGVGSRYDAVPASQSSARNRGHRNIIDRGHAVPL